MDLREYQAHLLVVYIRYAREQNRTKKIILKLAEAFKFQKSMSTTI